MRLLPRMGSGDTMDTIHNSRGIASFNADLNAVAR